MPTEETADYTKRQNPVLALLNNPGSVLTAPANICRLINVSHMIVHISCFIFM
jgi:hypothetical protein